jgi:nitroreductase
MAQNSRNPSDASDSAPSMIPFRHPLEIDDESMIVEARRIFEEMDARRTVREFSDRPVPIEVIEWCLRAASTAPSGAHRQPWHFAVVSDPAVKRSIRLAAEEEEREFYRNRAPDAWLEALRPLGTDENKPFLETAPWLIAIFARSFDVDEDGHRSKNYYVQESVGLATGLLISALHRCGLSTLTHTPSPMGFLNDILDRPSNERPFILLVVGHAASDARVPDLTRKGLDRIASFV